MWSQPSASGYCVGADTWKSIVVASIVNKNWVVGITQLGYREVRGGGKNPKTEGRVVNW